MDLLLVEKFLISMALGSLLGIERQISQPQHGERMAGIRTFALITLMGTLSAHLSSYPYLILVGAFGLISLIIASYVKSGPHVGITTEVGVFIAFLLGILCYTEPSLAVILTIFVGLILATRKSVHTLVEKISEEELLDTLTFALVTFVVLPFLPNRTVDPLNVLNPYKIWLIVVFISGISYVGYFLIRIFGARSGTGITGILGGLVSSTAVTATMSHRSREVSNLLFPALFAAVIANSIMFVRILVEVFVINRTLLPHLFFPMVSMMGTGLVASVYFWRKHVPAKVEVDVKDPFRLLPALKFGAFFAFILLVSKAASLYLGEIGVYAASLLSGLADVDAITLSMGTLAGEEVAQKVAGDAIILAAVSNVMTKTGMAVFLGSKEFGRYIVMTSVAVMTVGVMTIIVS